MEKRLVLLIFGLLISGIYTIMFLLEMYTLYVESHGRIVIGMTEGGLFDNQVYFVGGKAYVPVLLFTILTLSPIIFIVCLYLCLREWKSKKSCEAITHAKGPENTFD